ncbi:MAG: glutaminase [Reichenbachiella sp.]|uniref:glutaminase n=1 Tax=Reichenbachiella sp. TaxID=2184521 RepID=UPI003265AC69
MNYQQILQEISNEVSTFPNTGEVANYIPELAKVDPKKFGIHLTTVNNEHFAIGDSEDRFSIQSISKVFTVAMAFSLLGDQLWKRVGVEPSGNPFNSIVQLEYENGIPRNPFVNAGALVVVDVLLSELKDAERDLFAFVQSLTGVSDITYNPIVAQSEKETGYLNVAFVNMMKAKGNIENDADEILDFYYKQCSIEMNCRELACAFLHFGENGKAYDHAGFRLTKSQVKRINALMLSCGFYDESGHFAFKVGLAGKSGVGGGIAALYPEEFAVAVWSPKLNKKGNSVRGFNSLELLTTKTGASLF